jgi:hypothetical protein
VSRLDGVLGGALADLASTGHRSALVGGLAVSVRTEPRFTRDVDLAVAVAHDAQAEGLVRLLAGRGYAVIATVEQERTGRLATVRLSPPPQNPETVVLDLLFASSGIEPEIVAAAEVVTAFPDVDVPVARTGHLIALKLLSRDALRPQDDIDLTALAAVATEHDVALARSAAALISARGCSRDRDLVADLERLLAPEEPSRR